MIARGFIVGTKPISERMSTLQRKMTAGGAGRSHKTRAELMEHAKEQHARHHGLVIREH